MTCGRIGTGSDSVPAHTAASAKTFTVEVYDNSTPIFPEGVPITATQEATLGDVSAAAVADYLLPKCTSGWVSGATAGFTVVCDPAPNAFLALGTNEINCR